MNIMWPQGHFGPQELDQIKKYLYNKSLPLKSLHSNDCSIITAGVAVLLTILTMLSTPILTVIFGDGSLEVCGHSPETQKYFKSVFRGRTQRIGPMTSQQKWR